MKIYLTEYIHEKAYNKLNEYFEIVDNPKVCDGVITRNITIDKEWMDNAPNLKIIAIHGTGTDSVDLNEATKRGIVYFNVPNENSLSVAELNVALMLDISRNINKGINHTLDGNPELAPRYLSGYEISNKTVGFIGLGVIAQKTAEILYKGFNMHILGWSRSKKNIEYIKEVELDELLASSDYVVLGLSLNNETRYILDYDKLSKMKKDSFLINTARGALVKVEDLIKILSENRILGYAADVFEVEPIHNSNPLLKHNVIALPHIGANTDEALYRVGIKCVNKLIKYFNL